MYIDIYTYNVYAICVYPIILYYYIILYYIILYYILYDIILYTIIPIYIYIYILYILNGILTSTFRLNGSNPPPSQRHAWNRSVPASPNGRGHRHEASPDAKGSWEISSFNFQWRMRKVGLLDDYWMIIGWLLDHDWWIHVDSQLYSVKSLRWG